MFRYVDPLGYVMMLIFEMFGDNYFTPTELPETMGLNVEFTLRPIGTTDCLFCETENDFSPRIS